MAPKSTLLAGLAAALIQTFRSDDDFKEPREPGLATLLYGVSYGALFFNASVTVTSLVLIDKLGGMWRKSAEKGAVVPNDGYLAINGHELDIFQQRIESSVSFKLYLAHCKPLALQHLTPSDSFFRVLFPYTGDDLHLSTDLILHSSEGE